MPGRCGPWRWPLRRIDVLAAWTIVVAISGMVALVALQVLLRYAFNTSLAWTDETSRLAFVWSIFLGIPLGIRRGSHIGIEFLTAQLPAVPQDLLARGMALLGAALMALVAWQSVRIASGAVGRTHGHART